MHRLRHFLYYQENILYYISGYVVKKLLDKVKCDECFLLVTKQDHSKPERYMGFICAVNMGKLIYPSQDVFKIVCFYHSVLKHNPQAFASQQKVVDRVINSACTNFAGSVFKTHNVSAQLGEESHEMRLIKFIGYLYFKIIMHHRNRTHTVAANPSSTGLRQKLRKLVLFNHT